MEFLAAFKQQLKQLIPDLNGSKLCVAVSGGSDSLALSFLLQKTYSELNFTFYCVIIDHKLRKESSQEAHYVNSLLNNYRINSCILSWEGKKPTANIQENARNARYKILTDFCKSNNFTYLLTAHQYDDQAENFLIRLEHGAGLYGLSGIPSIAEIHSIKIIRPLLQFSKLELQDFLNKDNIKWIEDPSNQKDEFARSRARKFLNTTPKLKKSFVELSQKLNSVKNTLEFYVDSFIKENCIFESNKAEFNQTMFNALPEEIKFRSLEKIFKNLTQNSTKIRGERLANLVNKIALAKNFSASTLAKYIIKRKKDKIIIFPEN